jgi:hypothetical protein
VPQPPIVELREDRARARLFDALQALGCELAARIDDDEVVGIEDPSDVVHADREAVHAVGEGLEGGPAPTHEHRRAPVQITKSGHVANGRCRCGRRLENGGNVSGHDRIRAVR